MLNWLKRYKPEVNIPNTWAKFVIGAAVGRWTHADGKHRVYLIARNDGGFSCGSEHFSDDESEKCWIPEGAGGSIFASEEIAVREIGFLYPWSRDVAREERQDV